MKSLIQMSFLGNPAPDFTLRDENGRLVSLSDFRGSWVILYFYPKNQSAGCIMEAHEFRDHEYEIDDLGAVVLGVSPDDVSSHKKFSSNENLNFTLLSDKGGEVSRLYDVWREKTIFGTKHEGTERTTFLVNKEGKVAKIYSSVKPLGHVEKVIEDIREIEKKLEA